jgi:hypothetical protein
VEKPNLRTKTGVVETVYDGVLFMLEEVNKSPLAQIGVTKHQDHLELRYRDKSYIIKVEESAPPIPFQTTPEQQSQIELYAGKMLECGLDASFVANVSGLSKKDQGVYDLMEMWFIESESPDPEAQKDLIEDLNSSLKEYGL